MSTTTNKPEYVTKNKFFKTFREVFNLVPTNEKALVSGVFHSIFLIENKKEEPIAADELHPLVMFCSQYTFKLLDMQHGNVATYYSASTPTIHSIDEGLTSSVGGPTSRGLVCDLMFNLVLNALPDGKNVLRSFAQKCAFENKKAGTVEILLSTTTLTYSLEKRNGIDYDYHLLFDNGTKFSRRYPSKFEISNNKFSWDKV